MDEFGRVSGAAEISAEETKTTARIATVKNDMQKKLEEAAEACERNGAARVARLNDALQKKLEEAAGACDKNAAARVATLNDALQKKLEEASKTCDRNAASRVTKLKNDLQKKLEACESNGTARVATLQSEMRGKLDELTTALAKKKVFLLQLHSVPSTGVKYAPSIAKGRHPYRWFLNTGREDYVVPYDGELRLLSYAPASRVSVYVVRGGKALLSQVSLDDNRFKHYGVLAGDSIRFMLIQIRDGREPEEAETYMFSAFFEYNVQ